MTSLIHFSKTKQRDHKLFKSSLCWWRFVHWLFGIKQQSSDYFKSEIKNWPNVFKAINYCSISFQGSIHVRRTKVITRIMGWFMMEQLASQYMSWIMLDDLDILAKSKQIYRKIYTNWCYGTLELKHSPTHFWLKNSGGNQIYWEHIQRKEIVHVGWEKEWAMWQAPPVRQVISFRVNLWISISHSSETKAKKYGVVLETLFMIVLSKSNQILSVILFVLQVITLRKMRNCHYI